MILITAPLGFGLNVAFLKFSRGEEYRYDDLFWGFRNYSKVLSTGTLATTYTYLWMLLLIVPGIIKGYSYSLTPYLVYDKGLTNNAAIEESMRLMKGHKMRLFSLDFGYCLLMIVLLITIVGWLWVLPKWQVARANLYNDLIAQDTASQTAI